ncbi:MAG: hypothetical protein JSS35_10235, partial [Proteobacteria bacterium]|nr:hypothetical protein [Pseudomonadota bacterium]
MKFRSLVAGGLCMAVLLGGGSARALPFGVGGSSGPKSFEFSPDNPADAATHLAPATLDALKGVRRVAIAQVLVEYVDHSQGLTRKERGQISVQYGFQGPAAEAMQTQTDKLGDRLAAQLTAAGFEVVPREEVEASAGWKKLAGIGKPSGGDFKSESGSGRLFAAGARPYYFYPGDQHLGTGAMGWGFANAHMAEQAMATELNAAVVTLRLVVGIRETDKHNNSPILAIVKTASSFIGEPRIDVEAPYSGLFLVVPGKTGGMMKPTARAGFAV